MSIESISPKKMMVYLLAAGFIPLLLAGLWYGYEKSSLDDARYRLEAYLERAQDVSRKESDNRVIRQKFSDVNHFYIDQSIETIKPLNDEIDALEKVTNKGGHPDEETLNKHLLHLKTKNKIIFNQISHKKYGTFQESIETLAAPTELDTKDVKLLLQRIEGAQLTDEELLDNRPHLIITECVLERKPGASQEVYQVQMKLLKREYNN